MSAVVPSLSNPTAETSSPRRYAYPAYPEADTGRLLFATVSLRISAVLYLLAGAILAVVPIAWTAATSPDYLLRLAILWLLVALCVALAVAALLLVRGLLRRRRWAWFGSLTLFAFYLPSLFFPLGAAGLFGLLSNSTREQFELLRSRQVRRAPQ